MSESTAPLGMSTEVASAPLLSVEDLLVHLQTPRGVVRAVDGVSLTLDRGTVLGIVGESGSGKSVLMRSIMGLHSVRDRIARAEGRVMFDGVDLRSLPAAARRRFWGSRIGVVFQDPMVSLNPVVRIGRQITETLRHNMDLSSKEATNRAAWLLESVGVGDPEQRLRQYPHQLSGGLRQRVTIAIAIACEPDLLILDEPTTALDVTVQAQILALLHRLEAERGMAMMIVTHDLGVVAGFADNIAVMYAGQVVEQSTARRIFTSPAMPYTVALLASSPTLDHTPEVRLQTIEGRPPDMVSPPRGCRFHPRCEYAQERCRTEAPGLEHAGPMHSCRCWFPLAGPNRGALR